MPNSTDPYYVRFCPPDDGALIEPNSTSFFRWTVLPERPKLTRMNTQTMPHHGEMISAFLSRDGSCDGVFFTGVRTTGVFCRTTCPAKKPREENVEFFSSTQAALLAGFRPCKRCWPMEPSGPSRPAWLGDLMRDFDAEPGRRAGRIKSFETGG